MHTTKSDSKDDDDDDDNEEEDEDQDERNANDANDPKKFVDYVGDIPAKLKKNKLKYVKEKLNLDSDEYKDTRVFNQLLNKYRKDNGIKDDKGNHILFQKRFIALIDRRKSKHSDDIDDVYFYPGVAGKYTQDIPKDAVPEWGVSASRTCLLPNMNYKVSKAINDNIAKDLDGDDEKKDKNPSEDENIGIMHHCHGALLTASFHVRQEDKIKMYG